MENEKVVRIGTVLPDWNQWIATISRNKTGFDNVVAQQITINASVFKSVAKLQIYLSVCFISSTVE